MSRTSSNPRNVLSDLGITVDAMWWQDAPGVYFEKDGVVYVFYRSMTDLEYATMIPSALAIMANRTERTVLFTDEDGDPTMAAWPVD